MKPLSYPRSLAFALLLGSLGLSGCGGALNFPDAVVGTQVQGPSVQGRVFGGHAPIVGSHVYVLQPGTSGYGSAATSLLGNNGATSAGGYTLTPNPATNGDPNVPVGAMYETTDSSGGFDLTGGYTCTAGQPVYLYSYGTSAYTVTTKDTTTYTTTTTTTPTPETETITGITVAGATADTNGTATYTITLSAALPLTAGQPVAIAGLTGNLSILNGIPLTANAATTGANTTFSVTATAVYGSYTYSYYTDETKKNGVTTYSGEVTGTYYETVGNGAYTTTAGQTGNDGGGDDNDPKPEYEFKVTAGTPSTGTAKFAAAGMATADEPVTTVTTTPVTTSAPTTNPIVELSTLGICPSSGNFSTAGNGALTFVYMNEVSTVATAYTFQPFTLASNNNAWDIGSSGTTQALVGISNAALTAAQLYDIQGAALISTTDDGEGHLANYQTQSITVDNNVITTTPDTGNGVVPQATIDSLANILAACIDSTPGTGDVLSAQCTTLFNTATDNGETLAAGDTASTDTATAALNIARYPAGNHSAGSANVDPTYVSDIFGIPTGIVPYAPNLTAAPNDWTIVINYPFDGEPGAEGANNPDLGSVESIAVDDIGQIWLTAQQKYYLARWSPLGVENASIFGSYIYGYVSIDGNDDAWTGNADSISGIEEYNNNGVLTATYPSTGGAYGSAYTVVADNAGNAYFFASSAGTPTAAYNTQGNYEMWKYNASGVLQSTSAACDGVTGPFDYYCISQTTTDGASIFNAGDNVAHGAIESAAAGGHFWLTSEASPYQIARVSPTGVADFVINTNVEQPEFPSIDKNGTAWIANQATPSVIYKIAPTATTPFYTETTLTSDSTGAELTSTFGSAVDGNNNVWFANRCGNYGGCDSEPGINSIVEINGTGTTTPGTVDTAISPPTNYYPETEYGTPTSPGTTFTPILDGSLNVAIDPSGNVWITNYTGSSVAEIVGAAAPVVTPLSVAAGTNKLGQKP